MAKRRIVVSVEAERKSVQELQNLVDNIAENLSSKFTDNLSLSFTALRTELDGLTAQFSQLKGDEVSPKMFEAFNKQVSEISKGISQILTTFLELESTELTSAVFINLNKDIEEAEEKIRKLQERIASLGNLDSENIKTTRKKEILHGIMATEFGDTFTGTPESLGMTSIRKNIVHFEAYKKAVEAALNSLSDLKAKENTKEGLNAGEKEKLKALKQDEKKLRIIDKLIEATHKQINSEIQMAKDLNIELEKEIKNKDKLLLQRDTDTAGVIGEDPDLQLAQTYRGQSENVTKTVGSSKFDSKIEIENLKNAGVKAVADAEAAGVAQSEIAGELIAKYFSATAALRLMQRAVRKVLNTVSELDKAFVNIAVVTQYSNKEVWKMYDAFSAIGRSSGFSVAEISKVAGEYFRQGESYSNVIKLTEAAAKAAKVAGIDSSESVRYLTAAVRGYSLAAEDAMGVSDKFAALAASSATNYEGLATAMSKVAAQAYSSGVEMDNLMGMIATAMEVTQEAPENIGTAFKTIFARMAEIRDYGKVLEDGVDANRIEKALKTINVQLFDEFRIMRNLDEVLLEVGSNWHKLNQTQKAYLATSLAGTRQQTRLLAVLENYDRTLENIETSRNSAGATEAQQLKNLESIEHNFNRINVAIEGMTTALINNKAVVRIIKGIAETFEFISNILNTLPGKVAGLTLLFTAMIKATRMILVSKTFIDFSKAIGEMRENTKKTFSVLETLRGNIKNLNLATRDPAVPMKTFGATLFGVETGAEAAAGALGLLQGVMGAIAGVAVIVAITALAAKLFSVEHRAEKAQEKIKKFSGELYNLNQSITSIEKLTKEYEDLDKKIIKTTEDLERMQEIAQLVEDADMGDISNTLVNSDLSLNVNEAKRVVEVLQEEQKATFEKQLKQREKLLRLEISALSEADKLEASMGLAINMLADGEFGAWDEIDSKSQTIARNWSKAMLDVGRYIDINGNITKQQYGIYGEASTEHEERIFTLEDIERVEAYKNGIDESNVSIAEYIEGLKEASGDNYDLALANDAMAQSLERFSFMTKTSIEGLKQFEDVLEVVDKYGVDLGKEAQARLALAFDTGKIEYFSRIFVKEMQTAGLSMGELASMTLSLVEAFDELTEDGLIDMMTTFDSIEKRIGDLGKSLENLNTSSIKELLYMVREYPDLADDMMTAIEDTGNITEDIAMRMVEADRAKTKEMIQNEITQNEVRIEILTAQMEIAKKLLEDEAELNRIASDASVDINNAETEHIIGNIDTTSQAYKAMFEDIVAMAKQAGLKIPEALEGKSVDTNILSGTAGTIRGKYQVGTSAHTTRVNAIKDKLAAGIGDYSGQILELERVNRVLELSLGKIGTEAWNTGERFKETGNAAKGAADKVEEYSGQLHKLYVAQKKLELVNWGLDLIKAKQSYAAAADAVEGLAGAQRNLYDMNAAQALEDSYASYELQKQQLRHLIEVSEEYVQHHIGKLNPALKGSYKIIDGMVYPVSAKYKNLTLEQMKELDEFAKSVNELGVAMQGYTKDLYAAEQAQNELIAEIRDKVIEYQKTMIDIIKNQEKKQIDSFKTIIEANKKYLEERKKLYEKAFKDDDEAEELDDIAEKRQSVIEKLANLEAAHDLTSIQKREGYLKELDDLNSEYNRITLERNREAFLTSLDDQAEYQDEIYQREEELHNARIESGEWLEARLKEIHDAARFQALWDEQIQHQTLQDMVDKNYITQERLAELGLTNLNTTIKDLNDSERRELQNHISTRTDLIDKMWGDAEADGSISQISKTAMDTILGWMKTHSIDMEGVTSLMTQKIEGQWNGMLNEILEYTELFDGITLTGPNFSKVTTANKALLDEVKKVVKDIQAEYAKISVAVNTGGGNNINSGAPVNNNSQNKGTPEWRYGSKSGNTLGMHSSTLEQAKKILPGQDIYKQQRYTLYGDWIGTPQLTYKAPVKSTGGTGIAGSGATGNTVMAFATGGETTRTGFHWLDGRPGAPERVLSPGQNQRFQELLYNLSVESDERREDRQVIEALSQVVSAIYESSEENAEIIAAAMGKNNSSTLSLADIARSSGISTNRRGDK